MKKCEVCGCDMSKHPTIPGLLKCKKCGLIGADASLTDDELRRLYSKNYFCGDEYTDYLADSKLHKKNFTQKIEVLEKTVGKLDELTVFEIGCAYGMFLKTIEKSCKSCSGMDISTDAVEYAKSCGLNAESGDFLTANKPDSLVDIICMWDTIEHLAKPADFIKQANTKTKKDGYLCITTGDIGSLNAKMRGKSWRQIHPPTHLWYFSKETLSELLKNNGYEVVSVTYPGSYLSVRNILYSIICLKYHRNKLYDKISNSKLMNLGIYINLHDYIYIIGKKVRENG